MATRMLGGFILVALFLCVLLAWPGRRRWLIAGLCASLCAALALSLTDGEAGLVARLAAVALTAGFLAAAALRDLRDPLR